MFSLQDNILTYTLFGRCVQVAHIGYKDRLAAALMRYSFDVARIVADRPLELDEAYQLAVRCGLVTRG